MLFPPDCLRKFPRAICQALADEAAKKRSGPAASDPFIFLQGVLHEIRSSESDFAATQILETAAKSVFSDLQQDGSSIGLSNVEASLSQELVERVIRHCFLARVREGIGLRNKRSTEQQAEWESQLLSSLQSRHMLKSFFRKSQGAIRAPKRITPQRRNTLDELNQGLNVIEV